MPYVYSTLSSTTEYAIYIDDKHKEVATIERTIVIKGGANIINKFMVTPKGVMTQVSREDMAILMENYHFKEHMKAGFITVEENEAPIDEVVANMKAKDASAPKTPEDPEYNMGKVKVAETNQRSSGNKKQR